MNLLDLPQELILKVFEYLSLDDSRSLIKNLNTLQNPTAHRVVKLLWTTCCSDKIVVSFPHTETPLNEPFEFVSSVEIEQTIREHLKYGVVPKRFVLFLSRNPRDYTRFQNYLQEVWALLESDTVLKYLLSVPSLDFELRGNLITTESPTLLVSLILNTLVKLTNLREAQWKTVKLTLTDLGDYFPQKWGRVFEEFRLTQELILDDNLIRLQHLMENIPLLEGSFRWPLHLRVLSLRQNLISSFSSAAIEQLPKTLEVLDLDNNVLEEFGSPGSLTLAEHLPNLALLNLSNNRGLVKFQPSLLQDANRITPFLTLRMENCNLYTPVLLELLEIAKKEGVVLTI